ncbi:MAG: thioredoxin family protein [Desulfovibrio sp.]|jgi:thiol:disulfide interchange protein DsbD|nr:thioredoxin family protein [Desulfovibrio sp.]
MRLILSALLLVFAGVSAVGAQSYADCKIAWSAYSVSPDGTSQSSPPDPRAFAEAGPKVLLALTIGVPKGSYLYGPESVEGIPTSVKARFRHLGAMPMEEASAFVGMDRDALPLPMRAPAATPKKDTPFASVALPGLSATNPPLYPGPVTFWTEFPAPAGLAGVAVRAEFSGLLCSERNCMPVSDSLSLLFSAKDAEALPVAAAQGWWADYKRGVDVLVLTGIRERDASQKDRPAPEAFFSGGSDISGLTAASPDIGVRRDAPVFSGLEPVFFHPEQEIGFLGEALLFGLLAGMMLNLMPCVLPVVSLKFGALLAIFSMTDRKAQARAFRVDCLFFAAGIMAWFGVLALLLGVAGWAWGEIFQQPLVIAILALTLFVLGLSLFGVFHLPVFDLRVRSGSHTHWRSFTGGLLATLLATPCSGPLLGGVLAFAVRQPLPSLLLSVASVGLGMASPYLLIAAHPRLAHLFPRPGAWTLRLEQLTGFFLMGSVVYLGSLLPEDWGPAFLVCLFALALAAWLWGQIGHPGADRARRVAARVCALSVLALAVFFAFGSSGRDQNWERFEPELFFSVLGKEPLLLDFTADWCPSCKAMEYTTLRKSRMEDLRNRYKVRTIKVDLTRDADTGRDLLHALQSASIPVLALFPKGEGARRPVVLRDMVTPGQLEAAAQSVYGD